MPYEGKLSRTVWSRGKSGDYIKRLPIAIGSIFLVGDGAEGSISSDGVEDWVENDYNGL